VTKIHENYLDTLYSKKIPAFFTAKKCCSKNVLKKPINNKGICPYPLRRTQ